MLEGQDLSLPSTPSSSSDSSSIREWNPTLSNERGREIEQEVGRLYGHAPGPHPFFHDSNPYPAAYAHSQPITSTEYPVRARQVDYTHVPPVPSRLAISIPADSQSPMSTPMSSAVPLSATPRGNHYRGRPLPMPPGATAPIAPLSVGNLHNAGAIQYGNHGGSHSQTQVPEALLIDFDTEVDANTSASESAFDGGAMNRTDVAVENGDFSESSSMSAGSREDLRIPGTLGQPPRATERSLTPAEPRPQFSEYTDLDLLLSRMEGDNQNGSDYDVSHTTQGSYSSGIR